MLRAWAGTLAGIVMGLWGEITETQKEVPSQQPSDGDSAETVALRVEVVQGQEKSGRMPWGSDTCILPSGKGWDLWAANKQAAAPEGRTGACGRTRAPPRVRLNSPQCFSTVFYTPLKTHYRPVLPKPMLPVKS